MHPPHQNPFIFGPARRLARRSSMPELTPLPPSPSPAPLPSPAHFSKTLQRTCTLPSHNHLPHDYSPHDPSHHDHPPPPPPKDCLPSGAPGANYIPLQPFVLRAQAVARRSKYITIDDWINQARETEARAHARDELNAQNSKRAALKRCKSWYVNEPRTSVVLRSCLPGTDVRAAGRRVTTMFAPAGLHGIARRWTNDTEGTSTGRLASRRSTSAALRANMRPTAPIHIPLRHRGQLPDPEMLTEEVFAPRRAAIEAATKAWRGKGGGEDVGNGRWSAGSEAGETVSSEKERTMMEKRNTQEEVKVMIWLEPPTEYYLEGRQSWWRGWDIDFEFKGLID